MRCTPIVQREVFSGLLLIAIGVRDIVETRQLGAALHRGLKAVSWFPGGSGGQAPAHLFPAEAIPDLLRVLPEDLRPNETALSCAPRV